MISSSSPSHPKLLTANDVATELQVGARTVRGLIASGKIQSIRI